MGSAVEEESEEANVHWRFASVLKLALIAVSSSSEGDSLWKSPSPESQLRCSIDTTRPEYEGKRVGLERRVTE